MKDSVTKFDFDGAFKALDEIEIPVAEKGIKANRIDLKESMRKVDKFELLFEDFYDVNNADDMNNVSEEREAEVAKAKLARIEKIVDLDAETEDDILPSYVGKTIIQCPQCMTLFYKDAEDIVRDEENPNVVNVNEVCQHCGNESGYDVVGKVAEETEAAPGDELGTEDFSAEVGDGENDIAIDDGSETTEEAPAEEDGEVDELSAEADLDSLDLEEEPVEEEEEEANESLNTSELLKKIEDKNELKTEHESEKLTLNEDIEDNLDDKLKAHEDYIKYLRDTINEEEKKLANAKNEQVKQAIQKSIDAHREELEAALPEAVKAEAQEEELPDATEAGIEDATDNTVEEVEEEVEETTESLHEAVESMTDTLNRAWEVAKKTNSPIGVTVIIPVGAGTMGKLKEWSRGVNANLYYVDAKNPDLMANGFDEDMISRPDTVIVIDEFDRAPAKTQKAISDEVNYLDTQVEMVIVISHDSNLGGDNFKRFKQYVATVEKETATESLTEGTKKAGLGKSGISDSEFKELLNSDEFKTPVSMAEVKSFFSEALDDEEIVGSVEGDTDPTALDNEENDSEELTEANLIQKWWNSAKEAGQKAGIWEALLAVGAQFKDNKYVYAIPLITPTSLDSKNTGDDWKARNCPAYDKIETFNIKDYVTNFVNGDKKAANKFKTDFNPFLTRAKQIISSNYSVKDYTPLIKDASSYAGDLIVKIKEVQFILSKIELDKKDATSTNLADILNKAVTGSTESILLGIYNKDGFNFKATDVEGKNGLKGADSVGSAAQTDKANADGAAKNATIDSIEKDVYAGKFILLTPLTTNHTKWLRISTEEIEIKNIKQKVSETAGTDYVGGVYGVASKIFDSLPEADKPIDANEDLVKKIEAATLFKAANGKMTSRLTNFYNYAKQTFTESLDVLDIDEQSFNEQLTESLKEVYSNVVNFKMTDCLYLNRSLVVEGLITFKSGKTKPTSYVFEAHKKTTPNLVVLNGSNKDLFESGKIKIAACVLNESLHARSLSYKYFIDNNLVEGIIKHK